MTIFSDLLCECYGEEKFAVAETVVVGEFVESAEDGVGVMFLIGKKRNDKKMCVFFRVLD